MTVNETMHPAAAKKHVFKRYQWRLPEVLQELYFVVAKDGKIITLGEAKKWINKQEQVDALRIAAKRWRAIKLQHDGREIRLPDPRDFRGQYVMFRRIMEDWNEADQQARLLNLLPDAWVKEATNNNSVKIMLKKEHHTRVVNWTKANMARDLRRQSLRNALLINFSGDRGKAKIWRVDPSAGHPGDDEVRRRAGMSRRASAQGVPQPRPQRRGARR